ncbi:MAG: cell wall hydrolase [Lachnospiraceae bacterium]|nr:cell wall hydrolase [Lachnospiraceae bacterium]
MKKTTQMTFAFILAVVLFLGETADISATSTYGQLQEAQNDKEEAEEGIDSTQEDLNDLNQERADLQVYLNELNTQLNQASGELATIEALISEKEASIAQTQIDLEQAKEDAAAQYEAMKERIKFMYERGESAYLELFFSAASFGDFLSKAEYVEKLTEYDRNMLQKYIDLQERIRKDEQSLQDEMDALSVLRDEAASKQEEVSGMVAQTSANVAEYEDKISEKEKELLEYERQLEQSENDITVLQAKLEEEFKLTQQAASAGFTDLSDITFAAGDIDLLAAIIECEAGGEPYVGKVAVGNVVMNRVKSGVFPNTVLEVIYQNRQFSPVGSGRFAIVLARGANAECYQAAQDAMSGAAPVGNCLFFRTPIPGLTGTQIGGHIFY